MTAKASPKPKAPKAEKLADLEGRLAALEQALADGGGRHARLLKRAQNA